MKVSVANGIENSGACPNSLWHVLAVLVSEFR